MCNIVKVKQPFYSNFIFNFSPLISFTYSSFSNIHLKSKLQGTCTLSLGCGSSRFSCVLSSNSKRLFGLWTWNVVNDKNVNIFDDLHLDASCVLSSLYYSKFHLLLWVTIQYLLSCTWFIFGFLSLLSLSFLYHYLIFSFLFFSFIWLVWWVFNIFSN